ncbi:MAG: LexA family transcriptional regulator, partial [Crocinitomicaceae bacterium]|nr:LexA family transcriptional regulator [Crocinitomicaceae bacterium]
MMDKSTYIGDNLKVLRKRNKISQEELSKKLELTRSTYSGYENAAAEPSLDTLVKIADFYGLSVDVLLRQKLGDLDDKEVDRVLKMGSPDTKGEGLRILTICVDENDGERVELVEEKAKAGYTTGFSDPEYLKVLPTFSLPFLSRNKTYRAFQISGDSMPPVSNNSYVIGEYIQNWNHIRDGKPYVIVTKNEGVVFKIVFNHLLENRELELISTNPLYKPYRIKISEVLEVWK